MLTCAEDDQGIVRNFSLIYLVGDARNGYTIPAKDREQRIEQGQIPNAAVCNKHLSCIPKFLPSRRGIEKEVYAVYEGIDENPSMGMGYVSCFAAEPDTMRVKKYLSGEDMRTYLPTTQKMILEFLLSQAVLKQENLDAVFRRHNDGILRHFSNHQKERYWFVTGGEQLELANRRLARLF
ncbi:MAG: hypothetical protein AABX24_04720 [Nanoarchaeota archaeon]